MENIHTDRQAQLDIQTGSRLKGFQRLLPKTGICSSGMTIFLWKMIFLESAPSSLHYVLNELHDLPALPTIKILSVHPRDVKSNCSGDDSQ